MARPSAFYQYLQALVSAGLGKRLMFGSDQVRWPEVIGKAVGAIEHADFLSEEEGAAPRQPGGAGRLEGRSQRR